MTPDHLRVDYSQKPDYFEALQYVSGTELVPAEKTPRFVQRSLSFLYKALKEHTPGLTFQQSADIAIADSRDYEQAWVGQQLTRTLEPIIYQGVEPNILNR